MLAVTGGPFPQYGYRRTTQPRCSTWNTLQRDAGSALTIIHHGSAREVGLPCAVDATPLWTRARERLVATSIGRLISLQLKRRRRFSPQRAPWNTYSTARCSTWNMDTAQKVI